MLTSEGQYEFENLGPTFDPRMPYDLPGTPPRSCLESAKYTALLVKARTAIALIEGLSAQSQNPLFLISPFVTRESVASSGIENIHTTIAEVYKADALPEVEWNQSEKEVIRYRNAIMWASKELSHTPISNKIILGVFKRLMPEYDGQYRRSQNQITNSSTGETIYTPPIASSISRLISDWEKFVHSDDEDIDPLLRCIAAHYQFEAIHPFNDGNGRTGRILMVLQLQQYGLLTKPILFISGYILNRRGEYYDALIRVTKSGDWENFITYMLKAFIEQAESTRLMIQKINTLYEKFKDGIREKFPKWYSADLVEHLFLHPITSPTAMAEELGMTYQTASKYLKQMEVEGYLKKKEIGTYKLFINHKLLSISKATS